MSIRDLRGNLGFAEKATDPIRRRTEIRRFKNRKRLWGLMAIFNLLVCLVVALMPYTGGLNIWQPVTLVNFILCFGAVIRFESDLQLLYVLERLCAERSSGDLMVQRTSNGVVA